MFDIMTCCSLCEANRRCARLVLREGRGIRQYTLVLLHFSPRHFELARCPDELLLRCGRGTLPMVPIIFFFSFPSKPIGIVMEDSERNIRGGLELCQHFDGGDKVSLRA